MQGHEVDFNSTVYTKFRSKLFTIEADKYLMQNMLELGMNNMFIVRDLLRTESMFRFDHFFRTRTESELSKRMLSLYKLIEK
jgi:SWI/SNF-related matrix-associated actin-dependent regulator of chromatin subfamily A member 5